MQKIYILAFSLFFFGCCFTTQAQSVLDPNDSVITYDSTHPPTQPVWGQIGKWVRTVRLGWNTTSYKCYVYKGNAFRLKFPKSYNPTANDGKKYPMMVFFHGLGESGNAYDNEYQLYHGGDVFNAAVNNGTYDGYILCMQSTGFWGSNQYQAISEIIDYMVVNNKLDGFHVSDNGLSAGGQGTWEMLINYPTYISASLPMSASSVNYETTSIANAIKFTPLWLFQGGLDGSPAPYTSHQVRDYMLASGADFSYKEYSTLGHGTWDSVWQEPDFWPFQLRAYASNPWTLFGRTDFCSGDPINVTVGVAPGFDQYQWSNNGTVINTATSNTLSVTDTGTYSCRVRRGSVWSDWSHTPAHIKIKAPTVTPPINVSGLMSPAIPSVDGKNYVNLEVPDNGYTSYKWEKVGSSSVIGTDRILKVSQPGDYIVAVTEQYGCSSLFSPSFHVIDAKGAHAPDAAKTLSALTLSNTQIELDWTNNPKPTYNETAFEIYRSVSSGGSYAYVGNVPADTLTYTDNGLTPNVKYYYVVRAINNNGAAAVSNEASTTTLSDNTPPTAPGKLTVTSSTNSTVGLQWDSSTDNVGVALYEIYINGVKSYSTTQTSFTINGLQQKQQFTFYVKAKDISGNYSPQSNQVTAITILQGLQYKYYEGNWTSVPDFSKMAFIKTGVSANTDLSVRIRNDQFGMLWQGYIYVPVKGTYKFSTTSDEGSKLWLSTYDPSATPLVNNDGVHTSKTVTSAGITLNPGVYPISVAYFDVAGSQSISLSWTCTALFGDNNRHAIDDKYFKDTYNALGTAPKAPGALTATKLSYNQIRLSWNDSSNNETGFEIYRSNANDIYRVIYTTGANVTSFTDSALLPSTKYSYKILAINNYGSSASTVGASATTAALPAAPKAPTSVIATAKSSSQILLNWVDKATNEISYTIFRSISDTNHFKQLNVLPANTITYNDSSLFGHVVYYYKVVANGVGGTSASSAFASAKTFNNIPVINDQNSTAAPYGTTTVIPFTATDIDGDSLSYTILQLPSFATFTSNADNTASLTLNPSVSNQGVYNNIQIIVNDNNGGKDTTTFNLTINNNYYPTINSIADYTLNEGGSVNISLTAQDKNAADVLTWSVANAPNAFVLTPGSNGNATLTLNPNYSSAGTYLVQVSVNDGNGGTATKQFNVTVNYINPNSTVYIRFKDQDAIGSPWNNITGVATKNLIDANNNTTTMGLALQTSWYSTYNSGPSTGNNSGVYPDAVLKDYYYFGIFGGPETVTAKLTGLNPSLKYNITFYSGSSWSGASDNGTTTYTIGSQTVSLYVQNNTKNTASINNLVPASDSTITFTMAKAANTPVGYINALVVNAMYVDSSAPLAPQLLVAQNSPGQGVQLTWQDVAYNEIGYEIYRSNNLNGPFTLLDTTNVNAISFVDTSISGNTQYFYKIRAVNNYGQSAYTNVVSILTIDRIPQIAPISNIIINNGQILSINVTTNDDASDHVSLSASNLPPFVTFTDNGNGTGTLNIVPTAGVYGYYPGLIVTAKDNSDSSRSTSFSITVKDNNVSSVYLNFSDGTLADNPWNNLTAYPVVNAVYSNIFDENNNQTGITLKMLDGFQGVVASGMRPGNGKGIYPEVVMRSGDYEGTTATRRIQISGLNTAKKYNFVFFNSHDDGLNCLTNFTINGQTVSLNATYNIDKTVQINGISPDASGNVIISVAKAAGMDYAFISSLIIQSYTPGVFLGPTDLRIENIKRTSLGLQWADRSDSESNFEIWRSTGASYSLLATLPANTTSYTDASLSSNSTYYYQVRAKKATNVYSNYSNVAAGTTYAASVYVNFTVSNNAPTPWNNTDAPPQIGYVWNNFYDDTSMPTSVGLMETGTFAGVYSAGMTTGNNSGIFPDNVMIDSYGLFPGQSATIKVTGLNLSMKYDFTFFASSNAYGDVNVAYTVNGKTCLLNTSLNKTGTVTMYGITPNSSGEVTIMIAPGTATSQFGLIGALIVQGYNVPTNSAPAALSLTGNAIASSGSQQQAQKGVRQENNNNAQIKAYPNPFINSFNLSVAPEKAGDVSVEIYNESGKLVYAQKFSNLFAGQNSLNIQPVITASGAYVVKVIFMNENVVKALKILKQ